MHHVNYGEAEAAVLYIYSSPASFVVNRYISSSPKLVHPLFARTTIWNRMDFLTIIMTSSQPIELGTHGHKDQTPCQTVFGHEDQLERAEVKDDSLPPQDGGSGAWLFLFGACVFEIVSWGKYFDDMFGYQPWTDL